MYKKFSFLFWLFGVTLAAAKTGGPTSAVSEQDFLGEMPVVLSVSRLVQRLDEAPGAMTILDRNFIRMTGGRSDEVERIEVLRGSNSAAYGALLSLHTASAQVGVRTAMMVRLWLHGGVLPPLQYPADFSVTVNEHVVRSLGLKLDGAALADRLHRLETLS